jgi:aryl-alcohol dehydrogenase-like predicted oxidoreductase
MQYRCLGRNGPEVSVVGFGAFPIGGGMGAVDEATAIATLQAALEHGITLIDTAAAYGPSEELVGRALLARRDEVVLTTKIRPPLTRDHITEGCDHSLRALQTEVIDLYYAHAPDSETPIEETMDALTSLRDAGKVRYVGLSGFDVSQMEAARAIQPFEVLQSRYNILHREPESEVLPYCRQHGIGFVAHSPLAKGLLTGKYAPNHTFPSDDERSQHPDFSGPAFRKNLARADRIGRIARRYGMSPVRIAIGWTLHQSDVSSCLVGAKSPEQVAEHVTGQGWRMTTEALVEIEAALRVVD